MHFKATLHVVKNKIKTLSLFFVKKKIYISTLIIAYIILF